MKSTRRLDEAMVKLITAQEKVILSGGPRTSIERLLVGAVPALLDILGNALDEKRPFAGLVLNDDAIARELALADAILGVDS